ncbi:MAG TPA: fluoride efflux transporter CrcB [Methyloceanibacter sp.]|nr:fluoride efflux transporter CrcB [Methyloceanibacter sp.]
MAVYLWIAAGSALGGVARYWLSGVVARFAGETFPWGTLLVNVSGSLLIGIIAALTAPEGRFFIGSTSRLALMAGLLGGYTTFSSFSLQTLALLQDGDWWRAGANIVLSVVLCLFAVWIGYAAASSFNALR